MFHYNAAYKQQLITVYQQTGDFDKAVALWKKEIARVTKVFAGNDTHPEVQKAQQRLFDVYEQAGKIDELQIQTGNVVVTGSKTVSVDVKE